MSLVLWIGQILVALAVMIPLLRRGFRGFRVLFKTDDLDTYRSSIVSTSYYFAFALFAAIWAYITLAQRLPLPLPE